MKKTILICIAVALISLGVGILIGQQLDGDGLLRGRTGGSTSSQVDDLMGTGNAFNDGIATTTGTTQTIFSFASSTDETYWDTNTDFPQFYGATPTAPLLVNGKSIWTISYEYVPSNLSSTMTCKYEGSIDDSCDIKNPTYNTAIWKPLPTTTATGTPGVITADTSFTTTSGLNSTTTWEHMFSTINQKCVKLTCYNASTTDPSLLYIKSILN